MVGQHPYSTIIDISYLIAAPHQCLFRESIKHINSTISKGFIFLKYAFKISFRLHPLEVQDFSTIPCPTAPKFI